MLPEIRAKLEAGNVQIIEKSHIDPHFRTRTFVSIPGYGTLAYYDYLHQIPNNLYDGEEIGLGEGAIPPGEPIDLGTSCYNGSCGLIWDGDNPSALDVEGRELIPIGYVAIIIILALVLAIFICNYFTIEKQAHPCGMRPYEDSFVDDCYKIITYPDCSTITVDSCNPDGPIVVNRTDPPNGDEWGWITWLIVGGIAIGGIILAVKLIPILTKPKERPREGYRVREV